MPKNTSLLLGDYFDNFINSQVKTGRFSSASEVVRAALRMFEQEETKKSELILTNSSIFFVSNLLFSISSIFD